MPANNDIHLIQNAHGDVLFVVAKGKQYTPDELYRKLECPTVPARLRAFLLAADNLREAAATLPRVVQTQSLRAALARYRAARKGQEE